MTPTPDFTWLFLKTLAGLLLVLALAFVFARWVLPRLNFGRMRRPSWAKVIDRIPVDQKSQLYLIKLFEKHWIFSSSAGSLQPVRELSDEEVKQVEAL